MGTLYRARNWIASGPSFVLFIAAILLTSQNHVTPPKPKPIPPMRITITQPLAEPPPPMMPQMAPITPQTPDIALPAIEKFTPRQTPKPSPSPSPQTTQPVQSEEPATASAPPAAAAVSQPAPPAVASEDDAYSAQIRAYLETVKHYPTSKEARLQRPRGVVDVWFVLDRAGGIKDSGIETSSGSLILDGAALSLVRGASYPAYPADAFKSQTTHRFTVHLNYTLT